VDAQPVTAAGDLKSRVLAAARELFFAKGYFATSTREIAARAGTSESGVFRMYASKYEILMAVYNDCWLHVNRAVERRLLPEPCDPRRQLLAILETLWRLYDTHPLLMSFIIINTGNTDTLLISRHEHAIISEENIRYIRRLETLCARSAEAGVLPQHLTARAVAEGLLGISEGILLGWYLADKADKAATTEERYPDKVTMGEALALVATLLYGPDAPETAAVRATGNGVLAEASRHGEHDVERNDQSAG
jgi:AcrR family transcriptional regulator